MAQTESDEETGRSGGLIAFTGIVDVDYTGPTTLILYKIGIPSGLPKDDEWVRIPIVIK